MEENIHDCSQIREIRENFLPRMIPNIQYELSLLLTEDFKVETSLLLNLESVLLSTAFYST